MIALGSLLAEADVTQLASGGGVLVAAYVAVQFGRLVTAAVRLGVAAQAWLERHEELHASTLAHHQRIAEHVEAERDHRGALLRLLRPKSQARA